MIKRIFLFLLTNFAVIILLSIVLTILSAVFGINLTGYGYNYLGIFIFAAVVGFSGAMISLFISKWSAKKAYNIQLFSGENLGSLSSKEKLVYDTVLDIANSHGIKTPEVGIYSSQSPNAFATGASKNNSLVAVSSGLLTTMSEREIEGVVAHEMAHILNGDMVTMTLLQGVINTFVIFLSRIAANIVDSYFSRDEERSEPSAIFHISTIVFDIIFGLFASIIVMWFSRHREYRADEGSARYVGKEKMIAALEALKNEKILKSPEKFATMQIAQPKAGGWKMLFSSHPALDDRIKNLENMRMI